MRNLSTALVVGGAGFYGSWLVEALTICRPPPFLTPPARRKRSPSMNVYYAAAKKKTRRER